MSHFEFISRHIFVVNSAPMCPIVPAPVNPLFSPAIWIREFGKGFQECHVIRRNRHLECESIEIGEPFGIATPVRFPCPISEKFVRIRKSVRVMIVKLINVKYAHRSPLWDIEIRRLFLCIIVVSHDPIPNGYKRLTWQQICVENRPIIGNR